MLEIDETYIDEKPRKGNNKDGFLYVSSLYDITMKKVNKRLNSGRLVKVT